MCSTKTHLNLYHSTDQWNTGMTPVEVEFEGRSKELEFLLNRLGGALSGKGGTVIIAGEAGVGKTRLVEEFRKMGLQVGCTILLGRCLSGPPSSYLPFRDLLPRMLVTRLAEDPDPRTGEQFPFHFMGLVGDICEEGTLIIILEDMQYADPDSTTLLHFLGRKVKGLKVMVVCTYRPKEILNARADRKHPFFEMMVEMRRESLCEEMVLGPLRKMELARIAESILGGRLEEASLEHLIGFTGSNTLNFIGTLESMAEGEGLVRDGGGWKMLPEMAVPLKGPVMQAVLGQMDFLSRPERRVLELASVMGVNFDCSLVAEVMGQEHTKVSEMLDSIETRTDLIKEVGDGYCFSDVMTRDVIREQISPMRQRELLRAAERSLNK